MSRERSTALAVTVGILGLAALARLVGIRYGLPYLFYHHDEPQIVLRALRFGTGDFNPHIFWWPGTFQMDLVFVLYVVMFMIERAAGLVASSQAFAASYFRDPTAFYLGARLMTVAFSLATVWLMFALGKRTYCWTVGAVAAFFLSINAMLVEWSRLVLPLGPMLFWVVLALLACLRILESDQRRWYILAGVASGLAASCLYYGGVVIIAVPIAHWLRMRGQRRHIPGVVFDPEPYLAIAAMICAFVIVCPYSVLDFRGFRNDIVATYFGYARWESARASGIQNYLLDCVEALAKSLGRALGTPVAVMGLVGLALSLRRPSPRSVLVALFIIVYLAALGSSAGHRGRHMATVVPLITVLAASAVVKIAQVLPGAKSKSAATVILSVAIGLPSILEVARMDSEFMHKDTRVLAKEWFEAAIPAGTKIIVDASAYRNTASPPLEETDGNLERRIADLKGGTAHGYGYTAAYTKYYEMMLKYRDPGARHYDQWWTESGTNVKPIEWFRLDGYQYAITSSFITERYYDESFTERLMKSSPFYGSLDSLAAVVKVFQPKPWTRPGPTIKVYKIQ